jgi:hypothetical protein
VSFFNVRSPIASLSPDTQVLQQQCVRKAVVVSCNLYIQTTCSGRRKNEQFGTWDLGGVLCQQEPIDTDAGVGDLLATDGLKSCSGYLTFFFGLRKS